MDPQQTNVSWATVAEALGAIVMGVLSWLGVTALRDVRFLNRNAVVKKELETQFARMRSEARTMHNERMALTKENHEENKTRFDRLETKVDNNEAANRRVQDDTRDELHALVIRIEEVNSQAIQRDSEKQDRKD